MRPSLVDAAKWAQYTGKHQLLQCTGVRVVRLTLLHPVSAGAPIIGTAVQGPTA